MRANALEILQLVEEKCGRIFDRTLLFTREHTLPFSSYEQSTFHIPSYKTKKSINHVLPDEFHNVRITVVDDELIKIVEKDNAVIVPTWDGLSADTYLSDLVEELISSKQNYNHLIKTAHEITAF
jgi:hypothetical protein